MTKTSPGQGPHQHVCQAGRRTTTLPEGGAGISRRVWVPCTAGLQVAQATLDYLALALRAVRISKTTLYRKLDAPAQALVTIVYLRTNLTYAELAAGYGLDPSTMWRNISEGITALAGRAIRLRDVLRLARKMGWEYLLLDGTLVPTVAFGRKIAPKQAHYSGKHKKHGASIQTVCAPDGTLLWASAALPGKTHDVTAYRAHQLQQRLADDFATLAGLGCKGAAATITGYKKPRGAQLTPAQKAANAVHAALRSPGERGNAQLKWWRVLATEMRCRPRRCTTMVKACLTLHHLEVQPFTTPHAA